MFNWYCPLNYAIELEKKLKLQLITFWVTLVYYILSQKLLNRAAVGWAVSCSAFGIFFSFVGEQTQTPTRPLLSPDNVIISQLQAISQLFSSYPPLRSILSS